MNESEVLKFLRSESQKEIKTSEKTCLERGFYLCQHPITKELESGRKCVGDKCSVALDVCQYTHEPILMFHTHPCIESQKEKPKAYINAFKKWIGGRPEDGLHLSISDLRVFIKKPSVKFSCVGNRKGVSCYKKDELPDFNTTEEILEYLHFAQSDEVRHVMGFMSDDEFGENMDRVMERVSLMIKGI